MRTFAILATSLIALMGAFTPTATADDDCEKSESVNGGVLKVSVEYGSGCVDVDAERCTLSRPNPDYPSTPVWQCTKIL